MTTLETTIFRPNQTEEEETDLFKHSVIIKKCEDVLKQSWFWSKEWQKREKQATADIKNGRFGKTLSTAKEIDKYFK